MSAERLLDPLQRGWVAGLIEGEGCISVPPSRSGTIQVIVVSTDKDVLERLSAWTGMGKIYTRSDPRSKKWKPVHRWVVSTPDEITPLLEAVAPLLCERRREKAAIALHALGVAYA